MTKFLPASPSGPDRFKTSDNDNETFFTKFKPGLEESFKFKPIWSTRESAQRIIRFEFLWQCVSSRGGIFKLCPTRILSVCLRSNYDSLVRLKP